MIRTRSADKAHQELDGVLPQYVGRLEYLARILKRMEICHPEMKRKVDIFRRYYGVGHEPVKLSVLAKELDRTPATAMRLREDVRVWLTHPCWKDESTWPEPELKTALSSMKQSRVDEIAVLVLMWRYQSLGTEHFIMELKAAARELKIPDAEMEEFFKAIADRLMCRNA